MSTKCAQFSPLSITRSPSETTSKVPLLTPVLEILEIYPEDEEQLRGLFEQIDSDYDGVVSLEDFERNLREEIKLQDPFEFMTRLKLEEVKDLVKKHLRLNSVFLHEMREDIELEPEKFIISS